MFESNTRPRIFCTRKPNTLGTYTLAGNMNNNQIESFNGNTLRAREKVVRCIKKDDSAIIVGMQIHHNYITPHQGLDGNTPAGRAGIKIEGDNK